MLDQHVHKKGDKFKKRDKLKKRQINFFAERVFGGKKLVH
jgi:hypothetical protein